MIVACVAAPFFGCGDKEGVSPKPAPNTVAPVVSQQTPAKQVIYDLYNNRVHADRVVDGTLFVDCGSVAFARYVEGGYRSRWHLHREIDGRRAALISGVAGELFLPLDSDTGAVQRADNGSVWLSLEMRGARRRQLVSVFFNEHKLGDIAMPKPEWKMYAIRAPAKTVRHGENKLRLYFRDTDILSGKRSAAAIAMVAMGAVPLTSSPGRQVWGQKVTYAETEQPALRTTSRGRISYNLVIPDTKVRLTFAAASKTKTPAAVYVATEGATEKRVWSSDGIKSPWHSAEVDLSAYADSVVRLSFFSQGEFDWGRPRLQGIAQRNRHRKMRRFDGISHVIVWVISSLRADRFAQKKVPTPAFSRFAREAIWFRNARTVAPAPGPSHVAIATGRYPEGKTIQKSATTLAERFRDAGFYTALISGNGFVNDEAGFARGFQVYKNPMRRRYPFNAKFLWQTARQVLAKNAREKTFLYIVTVEPHLPYTPSEASLNAEWTQGEVDMQPSETVQLSKRKDTKKRFSTRQKAYVEALYNAEVRDADAAFGRMIEDLNKLQLTDRTAVFLVGDHGEELWERGGVGHGNQLFEEVQRVPLVIRIPGSGSPKQIDETVELVDLYPTILAVAGVSRSGDHHGDSLVPLITGSRWPGKGPIFSHLPGVGRSVTIGRFKLIVPLRGSRGLYDLSLDPGEATNLIGVRPIVERYLRNVFGIALAHEQAWSRRRWGNADNVSSIFASDHGL